MGWRCPFNILINQIAYQGISSTMKNIATEGWVRNTRVCVRRLQFYKGGGAGSSPRIEGDTQRLEWHETASHLSGQSVSGLGNRPLGRNALMSLRNSQKPLCPEQNEYSREERTHLQYLPPSQGPAQSFNHWTFDKRLFKGFAFFIK